MIYVDIDDRRLKELLKKSPRRANWAMAEGLKATGLHLRKKIIAHIKSGAGWPPLSEKTIERKQRWGIRSTKFRSKPLEIFARLVWSKFGKTGKGTKARARVGFFNTKSFFKAFYSVGAATIAKLHEKGNKSGKYGKRPMREMIGPIFKKEKSKIKPYFMTKFFKAFRSAKGPSMG